MVGLAIYLVLSIIAIYIGVKIAQARGVARWKGALVMALIMYLALFWDQMPTHVAHKYYCTKEGGVTFFKTLEEWKLENPDAVVALSKNRVSNDTNKKNIQRYALNSRFVWDIIYTDHFLRIRKSNNQVIDVGTGEILAQYVDFSTGQSTLEPKEFRDFKVWLYKESCEEEGNKMNRRKFYMFESAIEMLGSGD
ncbi:MAG: hypothetical protein KZQ80_17880 [Candidatus Thiodiazotropha sp. (ex Monitilora ramsayi)]|nr:hypothetical protein [Candidatus Thiodiazotropha sp. (ex Monitilora ramsayi)]